MPAEFDRSGVGWETLAGWFHVRREGARRRTPQTPLVGVSWPDTAAGWILERSSSPQPTDWSLAAGVPAVTSGQGRRRHQCQLGQQEVIQAENALRDAVDLVPGVAAE